MSDCMANLEGGLRTIVNYEGFEEWVRYDFRRCFPHAGMLCTTGRMLGLGSVATHRLGIDFPLNLVEILKNSMGALDDPMMVRWFRSGKPSFFDVQDINDHGDRRHWRATVLKYGIRSMSIHGLLDHLAKRFVTFQLVNPTGGVSVDVLKMLGLLSKPMAEAMWRSIETSSNEFSRDAVCHPTLGLTATELHIVELLAQGLSNKEIARRRGVSDSTIKTQVQRTGAKLGATRRAEIVAIAMPMLSGLPAQALIDYNEF